MEKYLFFDGTEATYEYTSNDWANYFKQFLSTGVYHTDLVPTLDLTASGTDMTVTLGTGSAILEGRMYENTADLVLTHDLPEATDDRIDRVVIRLDKTQANRYIRAFIKKGTSGASPVPPSLQRDSDIYEISLYQVRIIAGQSFVNSEQITDERKDETVCGLVESLMTSYSIVESGNNANGKYERWSNGLQICYIKKNIGGEDRSGHYGILDVALPALFVGDDPVIGASFYNSYAGTSVNGTMKTYAFANKSTFRAGLNSDASMPSNYSFHCSIQVIGRWK